MVEKGVLDSAKEGALSGAFVGVAIGSSRAFLYAQESAQAAIAETSKKVPRLSSSGAPSFMPNIRPTVSFDSDRYLPFRNRTR